MVEDFFFVHFFSFFFFSITFSKCQKQQIYKKEGKQFRKKMGGKNIVQGITGKYQKNY